MDDDDFYAPEGGEAESEQQQTEAAPEEPKPKQEDEDLEEGEEEDDAEEEDSDSDIDIITERKDGTKAAPAAQPRYNEIRNIPQRTTSSDAPIKPAAVKKESKDKEVSGADLPGVSTSKIDVDAKPVYEPAGKRITQLNIDEDLNENEKPWRRPGTDVSDYFNYGFDEFTWALYASKQETIRSEYSQDKIALNNKKMFEDMNMMMAMGGMPGMAGMGAGAGAGAEGMSPEMQAMMQQMMASGVDPSQMDPSMYAAMQGAAGGQANQGQGFGGQAGYGQGQNQQMDYGGYGQGGNNRGGNFGRGRGRGRW